MTKTLQHIHGAQESYLGALDSTGPRSTSRNRLSGYHHIGEHEVLTCANWWQSFQQELLDLNTK